MASATAGQTDTYAFGNLTTTSGTVFAVQASAVIRKDDAGTRSLALVARPGATDRLGATVGGPRRLRLRRAAVGHQPRRRGVDDRGRQCRGVRSEVTRLMAARVTQTTVEVLTKSSVRRVRTTQLGREALTNSALRRLRVSQFGVELLLPNEPVAPAPTGP